jgi:hypothetical protein
MLINKIKLITKNYIHIIFLFILSLNYLIPFLIFGQPTLFYIDTLDSEIVYNSVIGKILIGNIDAVKLFLNGEIAPLYLRRIFQPYSFFYSLLTIEKAYWIIDILVKLTSYCTFFILAKKINKNIFFCGLVACLYASSNYPSHEGFGLAFFPYLIYLVIFKDKINLKHYFILIFFGLNTEILFGGFALPSLIFLIFLISKNINLKHLLKVLITFLIPMFLVNINLFLLAFNNFEFHRNEFVRDSHSVKQSFTLFINTLLPLPNFKKINSEFIQVLPYTLFIVPTIIYSFFSNDKNVKKVLIVLVSTIFFTIIIKNKLLSELIYDYVFLNKISWGYFNRSYYLLYSLIIIFLLRNKIIFFSKILLLFIASSIFLFQIDSSLVPFYKNKILNISNYQNFYTFKGYYNFYDYKKIKQLVKNERTLSVGLDPMVAVVHNIYVIDGYHSVYPLRYKKKFRKIIEPELNINLKYKNYYDDWGSRVYTSLYKPKYPNNYKLNYSVAKELGAKFIISSISLNSKSLKLIYGNCEEGFCLYQIL